MQFPNVKIREADLTRSKRLRNDLNSLQGEILKFVPRNYNRRKLQRLRFRIFPFPREEDSNEYYYTHRNLKYICLNANLLRRSYYAALQFTLHGIAHSFCHLRDGAAEEAFCEYVGYSILEKFLSEKDEGLIRKAVRSAMRFTSKEYNSYFRAVRKLDKKRPGFLLDINSKAKTKRLSKKGEKKVIARYLKIKRNFVQDNDNYSPDLEKGFKKI